MKIEIIVLIFGLIWLLIMILPVIFSTKCPKCNKNCEESYYLPGYGDSFYYKCIKHGDITYLN